MACLIPKLSKIILSPKYKNLIDSSGRPIVPSSNLYRQISEDFNSAADSKINPKYVYTILRNNRYEMWDKVLEFHNFKISKDSFSDDSKKDDTLNDSSKMAEYPFTLKIPHQTWVIMEPENVDYHDQKLTERGYMVLKRKIWTDELYQQLWLQYKIQCPLSFRKNSVTESCIYLKISGQCNECGSKFSGLVASKPIPREDVLMECLLENYDESFEHSKKRQLKGKRRTEISSEIIESNILPSIWRRGEADKRMKFGDREPANLPKNEILRKVKQERRNIIFGMKGTDPVVNIQIMKYERHLGEIHSIGLNPFFVHYWTPEQVAVYVLHHQNICIDGTGSLGKKVIKPNGELSSHLYLYQILTETVESKIPVFQMLSASQNTNTIQFWLNEILRIGQCHKANFPLPKQVTFDFDKALLGACARVFAECQNLKDYLSKCFDHLVSSSDSLPSCFLRLDISHYVKMIAGWKELKAVNPLVRKFYVMIMAFITKCEDFHQLRDIFQGTLIICNSPTFGMDENGRLSVAGEEFNRLHSLVKGDTFVNKVTELVEQSDENSPAADEADEESGINIFEWRTTLYNSSLEKVSSNSTRIGEDVNPYYVPSIGKRLKNLIPYFPLYSSVMKSAFGYGSMVATSSAIESEFNDLKHRTLAHERRPMRIDKFVTTHLTSFSARTKLVVAEKNTLAQVRSLELSYSPATIQPSNTEARMEDDDVLSTVQKSPLKERSQVFENSLQRSDIIESNSDNESVLDKNNELGTEHNWRNKNEPKKKKRVYLDACPELKVAKSNKKRKIGIEVIQNGNLCPSIQNNKQRFIVKNTCGFDTIIHILAAASTIETYQGVFQKSKSKIFEFVKLFLEKGCNAELYKQRANFLGKVSCFVHDGSVPEVSVIDALSNITNLCELMFQEEPSLEERRECKVCNTVLTRQPVTISLDIETIITHGYEKISEAVKANENSISKKTCLTCKNVVETKFNYRSHAFIECIEDIDARFKIKQFPALISLGGFSFELAGIADYHADRRPVGHYTGCVKYGDSWFRIDDMIANPKPISPENVINPVLCFYVRV